MKEPKRQAKKYLENFTRSDFDDPKEYNKFKVYRYNYRKTGKLSDAVWATIYYKMGYTMEINWVKNV